MCKIDMIARCKERRDEGCLCCRQGNDPSTLEKGQTIAYRGERERERDRERQREDDQTSNAQSHNKVPMQECEQMNDCNMGWQR